MTIYTGWHLFIGGNLTSDTGAKGIATDAIDFTSRIRSFTTDKSVRIGQMGRHTAQVVLDNTDGALTPKGGGAYGLTDWLAEPMMIQGRYGSTKPAATEPSAPYFSGIIDDFRFIDDGVDNLVILTALDWYSWLSRNTLNITGGISGVAAQLVDDLFDDANAPTFGSAGTVTITPTTTGIGSIQTIPAGSAAGGVFAGDLADRVAISESGVSFPGYFVFGNPGQLIFFIPWIYRSRLSPDDYDLSGGNGKHPFTFRGGGTFTSGDLPFRDLRVGFNSDELVTQASITRVAGTQAVSANNTASQTYGPRSVSFYEIFTQDDDDSQSLADFYTTRFDTTDFTPQEFTVTGNMITGHATDDAATQVLVEELIKWDDDNDGFLWSPTTVDWVGAGGTTNTEVVVPWRVHLSATTTDWSMRVSCLPAAQQMGFMLNSSRLGVLDTNRIT
jgi:hypothetical protein